MGNCKSKKKKTLSMITVDHSPYAIELPLECRQKVGCHQFRFCAKLSFINFVTAREIDGIDGRTCVQSANCKLHILSQTHAFTSVIHSNCMHIAHGYFSDIFEWNFQFKTIDSIRMPAHAIQLARWTVFAKRICCVCNRSNSPIFDDTHS